MVIPITIDLNFVKLNLYDQIFFGCHFLSNRKLIFKNLFFSKNNIFLITCCYYFIQEMQLDLIGFARAVAIAEIRVIPNGCKVHPDIRDRLG